MTGMSPLTMVGMDVAKLRKNKREPEEKSKRREHVVL